MKKGVLTVISGFSGVGKGTVVKELLKRYPEDYALSVSATTRAPRPGEEHGREYFFVTREEFLSLIENEMLYEHAEYNHNFYGTPKAYVQEQTELGKNVILEIDVQGGLQIKEQFPDTLLIYIIPPSAKELKSRLVGRGTETLENVNNRMRRAINECDIMTHYEICVMNDCLDDCVEEMHKVITEGYRTDIDCLARAAELKEELIEL